MRDAEHVAEAGASQNPALDEVRRHNSHLTRRSRTLRSHAGLAGFGPTGSGPRSDGCPMVPVAPLFVQDTNSLKIAPDRASGRPPSHSGHVFPAHGDAGCRTTRRDNTGAKRRRFNPTAYSPSTRWLDTTSIVLCALSLRVVGLANVVVDELNDNFAPSGADRPCCAPLSRS